MSTAIPKKLIALCAATATALGSFAFSGMACAADAPVNIADRQATAETRALFAKLRDTKAGEVRFGQQHATDEAISETATQGDVYEMTGKHPAVFGWDAGLVLEGREKPGSGSDQAANAAALAAEITRADALGAIVTLSAHWSNPKTGGNYDDTTRVVSDLLPGGAYSGTFNTMLDGIAAVAEQSKRADGTRIPIIFRPLHENTGNWFWWGATHATAAEYKELFRYVVNYLRDVKGVHNLLYAYSPGGTLDGDANAYLKTYPGDGYVDVLGYDTYDTDNTKDDASAWLAPVMKDMKMLNDQAAQRGKIVAFTEFGRSNERGFKKDSETKDRRFFTELRDAITAEAPNTAYMMTWANFGGSGSNFQAYTPWKGQDAEPEFVEFSNSSDDLMASPANVDYTNAPAAAVRGGTARIVTPVAGDRVTAGTIEIRVKVDDANLGNVRFDDTGATPYTISNGVATDRKGADGNFVTIPLTYTCNGYLTGTLDLDKAGITGGTLRLAPQVALADGTMLKSPDGDDGTIEVALGEAAVVPENVVDDFDAYSDDDALNSAYSPNNGKSAFFTLVESPQGADHGNAVNLHYDYTANPGYTGYARSFDPKRDWSAYTGLELFYKPDGSNHKLVIQMNANGVTFEAYPSLNGTDAQVISLPFGEPGMWNVASWDTANAGKLPEQKLLSKVGSFAIYVNDNDNELQDNAGRPRAGDLVFDSIRLVGERDPYVPEQKPNDPVEDAEPIEFDDFESYADEAAMKEAWGNRGHTDVLSLGTEEDGNQYLQYSNPTGGWLDVATVVQNDASRNVWSGLGKLTFHFKHDGSGNAMAIQIGTADGKYFHVDHKLAAEDGTDWKTVEVDLVDNPSLTQSWPEDANKGKTMTADDLTLIKEVVIAGNTWNNDAPAVTFAVDDMKVMPGDGAVSTPAPEEPTEPAETPETPDYSADVSNGDPASCPITFAPVDADGPVGPSTPSDPEQPADVSGPAVDAPAQAAGTGASAAQPIASTGASVGVIVAVALAALAGAAAVLITVRRRRA
ncbi:mannan endo-1,4-beta-mannosidase [Bifidobacterium pseudolongum subsp. globosum]|uniref:glycosyl hydrolase n=1 Tax=Bifidobacterium pseudolongum TaxID=1694 RepID=UPI00101ED433|nr:glycosyl hydrolase [Bifidobacterium pseudolongum]RYQ50456.1 mannan endo-1,4-beta-mannosidase [Bifidobacterium pseudolongum subsp. globosum]